MTHEHHDAPEGEALPVLRGIWNAQRQSGTDIEAPSTTKVCKNMKNIGFGGIAEGGADADSTAGPVGDELRSAWRDRLAREGKLAPGATSLRDLVMKPSEQKKP
ncbi:hypothetical protein [Pseudonocardia xinjiangensis]|jgi:hypothetical protein|uniref:Lsr2 protein n=1 Tax=Pseudonocardia xinjiangensis TaxID=75289 RepID=A0ABX1RRN5_9PSEU|nr:hypothetical protein [Pseudonocardia xinjiangensis]NMH82204.1 hypothetical protein [Pseudonocardia xinjiangensis]